MTPILAESADEFGKLLIDRHPFYCILGIIMVVLLKGFIEFLIKRNDHKHEIQQKFDEQANEKHEKRESEIFKALEYLMQFLFEFSKPALLEAKSKKSGFAPFLNGVENLNKAFSIAWLHLGDKASREQIANTQTMLFNIKTWLEDGSQPNTPISGSYEPIVGNVDKIRSKLLEKL